MKQPLIKLGLLVVTPILLHTFVPMQVWWPAISYSGFSQSAIEERVVEFDDLTVKVAGEAIVVLSDQQATHIFSERRFSKLQALQKEGRTPASVTMQCKQNTCVAQPSDAHFATFLVTFIALLLAFTTTFGIRYFPTIGGFLDMDTSDTDA
ncbi:hypothetical protein SAMN05444141_101488 [Pseudovibrio denitrificans]|uniref:Uncharacterized protein n=1 Tax=Pseudovibrio denitrificans TaxID=258256 RepID=A0A1I6XWV6_9HYPH|nr:hypothetical protein [Pseudovibrio denitrificans]SFT42706.1 hypothetical protein SAMN05444141_101488 [Pseudovibrio denitrificans]